MMTAASKYPVRADGMERADRRFEGLAKDVARVYEQHGFPRHDADALRQLDKTLFEHTYGSRGAAGEMERRLNGTAAPLVSPEGKVDSYACFAAAQELRRLPGAAGALVLVVGVNGMMYVGTAVDPKSPADLVASKVIAVLDGLTQDQAEAAALDVEVDENGRAS